MAANDAPIGNGKPVFFSRADAERIAHATRAVESLTRNPVSRGRRVPAYRERWIAKAMTGGSGVPAATSQTSPGKASATLYAWNPASDTWTTTGATADVYNPSTAGPVAASTLVTVAWLGIWEVILEPCPA